MRRDNQLIAKTVNDVIAYRMTRQKAAQRLGVSVRTIHNYVKKFQQKGPNGLFDHRRGHYRKIVPELEMRILAAKLDQPTSSARWLRDRLKLPVSVEAVRKILLKHRLNRSNLGLRAPWGKVNRYWNPF